MSSLTLRSREKSLLPRQDIKIINQDGTMNIEWYRAFQDIFQFSGLNKERFPLYEDAVVPAQQMTPVDIDNQPDFDVFIGSTRTFIFPDGANTALHFTINIPHGYVSQTNVRPFVQWSPMSATGGNVVWHLDWTWGSIDHIFTAQSTATCVSQTATALDDFALFEDAFVPADTNDRNEIFGTEQTYSGKFIGRISRQGTDGSDTYGGDVALLGCGVHFLNAAHGTTKIIPPEDET